jgi:hypothetical protein
MKDSCSTLQHAGEGYLPLVVAEQEKPLKALVDLMLKGGRTAWHAAGTARPILGARRTLELWDVLGNVACRGAVYMASIDRVEDRLGLVLPQLMDL